MDDCLRSVPSVADGKVEAQFDTSKLTVDELQRAEIVLIKYIQAKDFTSVISNLSNHLLLKKSTPRFMLKLSPILADGILRVGVDWQILQLTAT